MTGPKLLLENENHWHTDMGKWYPGERVDFRGRELHRDLARSSWISLYMFAVTGREHSDQQVQILERMIVQTNYPDPRIWNNRVAALAGTARSTGSLGISAALAVSEATIYGRRADVRAYDFLTRTLASIDDGVELELLLQSELKRFRVLPGYGRPIVSNDERIECLCGLLEEMDYKNGPAQNLAFEIERSDTTQRYRFKLNYAGLTAAICLDLGLAMHEFYLMAFISMLAGMVPCFLDTWQHEPGTFYPMRVRSIEYIGKHQRSWVPTSSTGESQ